jgi:hypothetical protein
VGQFGLGLPGVHFHSEVRHRLTVDLLQGCVSAGSRRRDPPGVKGEIRARGQSPGCLDHAAQAAAVAGEQLRERALVPHTRLPEQANDIGGVVGDASLGLLPESGAFARQRITRFRPTGRGVRYNPQPRRLMHKIEYGILVAPRSHSLRDRTTENGHPCLSRGPGPG